MKKSFILALAAIFCSTFLYAADEGVKVTEETKNKGEAAKIENKEQTKKAKGKKEMKKEMKQERKQAKEEKKDMKGGK